MSKIFSYIAILTTIVSVASPATALPGQNVKTFVQWAKTRPQLPVLKYNPEIYGYYGQRGNLHFLAEVTSLNGTVNSETITLYNDADVRFTTNNLKGLELIANIYSPKIANDYRHAHYVAIIGTQQFYRGQKFGYIGGGRSFQITTLDNLQQSIDNARFCQTNQCDI